LSEGNSEGKQMDRRKRPLRLFFVFTFAARKLADFFKNNKKVKTKKEKSYGS
jgi:hypothetical protein